MTLFGSFRRPFLTDTERAQLEAGLAHAIHHAGAPIALHIDARAAGDPDARASVLFGQWALPANERSRAVLLYACAATHRFAVAAGDHIRGVAPETFWAKLDDDLARHFREERYCDGLFKAIADISIQLRALAQPAQPSEAAENP